MKEKFESRWQTIYIFLSSAKTPQEKNRKRDEQTLAELSSTHRRSQAKYQFSTNQLH